MVRSLPSVLSLLKYVIFMLPKHKVYFNWLLTSIINFLCSLYSMSDICSETTYETQVDEAKIYMQQRLPEYVVKCSISSGFDTLSLIADMDMESLDDVEHFCDSYPGQTTQNPVSTMASGSFRFPPPGHRSAILRFIEEVHVSVLQNEKRRGWIGKKKLLRQTV